MSLYIDIDLEIIYGKMHYFEEIIINLPYLFILNNLTYT